MRKKRVKVIRKAVKVFKDKGIIQDTEITNANRFFKRAWKRGQWKTQKKELDQLLEDE